MFHVKHLGQFFVVPFSFQSSSLSAAPPYSTTCGKLVDYVERLFHVKQSPPAFYVALAIPMASPKSFTWNIFLVAQKTGDPALSSFPQLWKTCERCGKLKWTLWILAQKKWRPSINKVRRQFKNVSRETKNRGASPRSPDVYLWCRRICIPLKKKYITKNFFCQQNFSKNNKNFKKKFLLSILL